MYPPILTLLSGIGWWNILRYFKTVKISISHLVSRPNRISHIIYGPYDMDHTICIRNSSPESISIRKAFFRSRFLFFLGVNSWEHEGYHYIWPFKELIEIQGGGDVKPSRIWRNDLQSNQRYLDKIQKSVKWR